MNRAPARPPPPANTARAAELQRARAVLAERLPTFAEAWRALSYSPHLSFTEQCVGRRGLLPEQVAAACLPIVERVFGVCFSRVTTSYDEEHGTRGRVPNYLLADFYESPTYLIAMAACKLVDGSRGNDDVDATLCVDEIAAMVGKLASGPSPDHGQSGAAV